MNANSIHYYSTWANRYDEQVAGLNYDVAFYVDLARGAGGRVVEVGAGTGRIAIPLAAAGARVLGLDLHREMLEIARRKVLAAGLGDRLHLVQADMRRFALHEPAAVVLVTAQTFMYNLTTEDQLNTLRACHAALEPGGTLCVHVFNPDVRLIADWLERPPDEWKPQPGSVWSAHRAQYWPTAQLTRGQYRRERGDGSTEYATHTLRWVYRYEMEHLLMLTGFEVETVFGDFNGRPLEDGAPAQIWVARRRATPEVERTEGRSATG